MKRTLLPLAVLALALLLVSCAGRGGPGGQPADPARAQAVWASYLGAADRAPAPYQDSMSLRFGKEGDTRRVTALMWGNGENALRLDVMAGVGVTVAMVGQAGEHFLIYSPMEGRAYFHEGARSPLLKIGVPLPLDLSQLDALLHGRYQAVFGTGYTAATTARAGTSFALAGGIGGELVLDGAGRPAGWSGSGWQAAIALDEQGLVERLDLANVQGQKAILIVKERAAHAPFSAAQMKISLPEGTELRPLTDALGR